MCSYCGCEAEPLVTELMGDHAAIADLAYRINQFLDAGGSHEVPLLLTEVAERFRVHSLKEEAGLFAELAAAGEAGQVLERLRADHAKLRPLLASPDLADDPRRLRAVLSELTEHAETEDDDLFPYALQFLPARSWDRVNQVAS